MPDVVLVLEGAALSAHHTEARGLRVFITRSDCSLHADNDGLPRVTETHQQSAADTPIPSKAKETTTRVAEKRKAITIESSSPHKGEDALEPDPASRSSTPCPPARDASKPAPINKRVQTADDIANSERNLRSKSSTSRPAPSHKLNTRSSKKKDGKGSTALSSIIVPKPTGKASAEQPPKQVSRPRRKLGSEGNAPPMQMVAESPEARQKTLDAAGSLSVQEPLAVSPFTRSPATSGLPAATSQPAFADTARSSSRLQNLDRADSLSVQEPFAVPTSSYSPAPSGLPAGTSFQPAFAETTLSNSRPQFSFADHNPTSSLALPTSALSAFNSTIPSSQGPSESIAPPTTSSVLVQQLGSSSGTSAPLPGQQSALLAQAPAVPLAFINSLMADQNAFMQFSTLLNSVLNGAQQLQQGPGPNVPKNNTVRGCNLDGGKALI